MSSPSPIQHTSERVLEFDQLRQVLAIYTRLRRSGTTRVMQLTPSRDRAMDRASSSSLPQSCAAYLRAGGRFDFMVCSIHAPDRQVAHYRGGAGDHRNS